MTLIYFYLLFLYSVLCRLWCSRLLFCSMWSHGIRQNRQILVRSANSLWNLRVSINVPFLCCSLIWNTGLCETYISSHVWLNYLVIGFSFLLENPDLLFFLGMGWHSSEIRDLCLMKLSCKNASTFPYF